MYDYCFSRQVFKWNKHSIWHFHWKSFVSYLVMFPGNWKIIKKKDKKKKRNQKETRVFVYINECTFSESAFISLPVSVIDCLFLLKLSYSITQATQRPYLQVSAPNIRERYRWHSHGEQWDEAKAIRQQCSKSAYLQCSSKVHFIIVWMQQHGAGHAIQKNGSQCTGGSTETPQ